MVPILRLIGNGRAPPGKLLIAAVPIIAAQRGPRTASALDKAAMRSAIRVARIAPPGYGIGRERSLA